MLRTRFTNNLFRIGFSSITRKYSGEASYTRIINLYHNILIKFENVT